MEFAAIAGVVVVAAFLAVLLRQKSPEQSMAVGLLTGVGVMALLLTKAAPSLGAVKELMDSSALPAEYGQILFKALGICLLTQLAADACRDAGESALAGKAELAGKVGLIMLSLPLFQKIAELAVKHDLLVISDDVYNTLLYAGEEAPCIASFPGMKERTVIVNSFSKSYAMTGWRIGFVAAPAEIVDRMTKCQENFNACANAPGQYAATVALDHPELCEELRQVFERRRSILLDGLAKIDGIRCNRPNGAFYVFADISSFGLSSVEFCNRLLDEQKVVCIPGSAFGECGEGFIRIAYTCSDENLHEALRRIDTFCKSL